MKIVRCIIWTALVLLLSASAPWAAPGPDWTVRKVRVEGLETLSAKQAKTLLAMRQASFWPWNKDQAFDPVLVESDIKNLTDFLQQEGFFEPVITHSLKEIPSRKKVDVIYAITEGPPILIKSVAVRGVDGLEANLRERVQKLASLAPGHRLRTEPYGKVKDEIVTLLNDNGYPNAVVAGSIRVDKEENSASITIDVKPGMFAVFGPVTVKGLEKTDPEVILSRVTFEPGQTYKRSAMDRTQREIFGLGFVSGLTVKPPETAGKDSGEVPLEISADYKKFKSFRFGVGYGTEDRLRVQAGWRHRHLTSQAWTLDFLMKYSEITQSAEVNLWDPEFLSRKQELKNTTGVKRQDEVSYVNLTVFNDFTVTRKIGGCWLGLAGHELELHRLQELTAVLEENGAEVDENYLVSSLTLGVERDSRPRTLNPRSGTFWSNRVWWGGSAVGSEVDYCKFTTEGSALFPLGGALVLASRLRFSGIQPMENTDSVPVFMRLFAGGSHSVRGYPYQKLGPEDAYGDPVGGQSLWEGSVEMRFPLYKQFSGVLFSDAGAVLLDPFSFDGGEFRYTAGPGLRYQSPVGALSLDLGFQLNPQNKEDDAFCVHFSVGQSF